MPKLIEFLKFVALILVVFFFFQFIGLISPEISLFLVNQIKVKKMNNYKDRSKQKTKNVSKKNLSKCCQAAEEFWRTFRECKAGQGSIADGYCAARGVIVFEKPMCQT